MDPGPLLDTIDNLFTGLLKGVRAQPINIPGFAYHHARQVHGLNCNLLQVQISIYIYSYLLV